MIGTAVRPSMRQRFSIAKLALALPWVALVIGAWGAIGDNSFLWHVRAGTYQARLGEVLTEDPFSFTRAGAEWLTQSWLVELLYGWLEGLVGLAFVPWLILVVTALTFLGVGLIAYRISQSITGTAFVLVLSTVVFISFTVPRPVVFSYLLFVLVIAAWERPPSRWTLPFLFWIWASVHGSFVIGLAFLGLALVMRQEWKALPKAIIAGLATLVTAHGLGTVKMLLDFGGAGEALSYMSEWRSPTLDLPAFVAFAGGVVFVILGAGRRLIEPRHLWLIIPFVALGLTSVRAVPPAWLGLMPLVALALSDLSIGTTERLSTPSVAIFGLVVFLMPFFVADEAVLDEDRLPVEASEHLSADRVFHDDRVGGYLIWAQWPERRVYLDDRAELYDDRITEFAKIRAGELDWRPVFERDEIKQALLFAQEPLASDLTDAGWTSVHEDEIFVVLVPG